LSGPSLDSLMFWGDTFFLQTVEVATGVEFNQYVDQFSQTSLVCVGLTAFPNTERENCCLYRSDGLWSDTYLSLYDKIRYDKI